MHNGFCAKKDKILQRCIKEDLHSNMDLASKWEGDFF